MKFSIIFIVAVLFQLSLAAVRRATELEKEFSNIEKELERITSDEAKSELEAELLKLSGQKDESKTVMKDEIAQEHEGSDYNVFHTVMKKFDSGSINKGQLVNSLEDYFSGKNQPASDVSMDSSKKCKDVRVDCKYLKSNCKTHVATMKQKCAKTCGYCVECENNLSDKKCAELGAFKYCSNKKYALAMKQYCYKECGYCRPSNVPECSKSKHGCCWDKVTIKANPEGSNCPLCTDEYKNACKTFKGDCMKKSIAGQFMRQHCSLTCEVCKKCFDEPTFADKCKSWKMNGWCEKMKTTMEALCKNTCNLC